MKVRLLNLGRYQTLQEIGDIVNAKPSKYGEGYICELQCDYGKDELWFSPYNVEVIEGEPQTDSIVESVINQFKQRSEAGINKYGTTLDRDDLSTLEWIEHAKQEAMDFIIYLEKLKHELK